MRIFLFKVTVAISIGNKPKKTKYPKITLSEGPSANLRPLYNSNVYIIVMYIL